jgi:predicted O-methyltransferase YrrM
MLGYLPMLGLDGPDLDRRILEFSVEMAERGEPAGVNRVAAVLGAYLKYLQELSKTAPEVMSPREAQAIAVEVRERFNAHPVPPEAKAELEDLFAGLPRAVDGMERYRFTHWAAFMHERQWLRDLGELVGRPNVRFLEVGSYEGRSACWLLNNVLTHESARLTCVDRFLPGYRETYDHNIAQTGASQKVTTIVGQCQDVLCSLEPRHYDFIYLDASSDQRDTIEDAVLAWRLLKERGILTFDDYGGGPEWEPGVTLGVDAFLHVYAGAYEILHKGFQVTVRKTDARASHSGNP